MQQSYNVPHGKKLKTYKKSNMSFTTLSRHSLFIFFVYYGKLCKSAQN